MKGAIRQAVTWEPPGLSPTGRSCHWSPYVHGSATYSSQELEAAQVTISKE